MSAYAAARSAVGGERPAIVLGGYTSGLGVVRALGRAGVPVVVTHHEAAEVAQVSKYASRAVRSPHPEEAEEDYVAALEALEPGVLFPGSDATLTVVARHHDRLAQRHLVSSPRPELVAGFLDKGHTYATADRLGVPVPRSREPGSATELERAGEVLGYPCLVKPRESHTYYARFGRKMVKARDARELTDAWTEASEAGLATLVQEFVPGDDKSGANYNAYLVDGRPVVECTAQKVRLAPEEIGFPRVVVSREIPEIAELGRRLLGDSGMTGFANVEFKRHATDGEYRLMEVNARHNMSTLLSVRSGMNFPLIDYRRLVLGELPGEVASRPGVYWISPISDLSRLFRGTRWTRSYLRPYLEPHVFDVLDPGDPRPFARSVRAMGAHLLGGR